MSESSSRAIARQRERLAPIREEVRRQTNDEYQKERRRVYNQEYRQDHRAILADFIPQPEMEVRKALADRLHHSAFDLSVKAGVTQNETITILLRLEKAGFVHSRIEKTSYGFTREFWVE